MPRLILEPTSRAQWQTLVHEAQSVCNRELDETLESYLVFQSMTQSRIRIAPGLSA